MPTGVFDPRWARYHRPTVKSAMLGTIKITRVLSKGEWDPVTGMTGGSLAVLFEGAARWQKVGRPTKREHLEDSANFNTIRVQIDFADWDDYQGMSGGDYKIHPNDKIEFIENKSNPLSNGEVCYVWGDSTSSNAWQMTLTCQENMKQVG